MILEGARLGQPGLRTMTRHPVPAAVLCAHSPMALAAHAGRVTDDRHFAIAQRLP